MPDNILLLSIKPEYADKIFDGAKTVELRRVRTRLKEEDLVLVYVSSPEKALVGYFEVESVIIFNLPEDLNNFWKRVQEKAGIEQSQFYKYYKGASVGVAIFLKNPHVFPKSLKLESLRKELPNIRPPQSYRYLTKKEVNHVEKIIQHKIISNSNNSNRKKYEKQIITIGI